MSVSPILGRSISTAYRVLDSNGEELVIEERLRESPMVFEVPLQMVARLLDDARDTKESKMLQLMGIDPADAAATAEAIASESSLPSPIKQGQSKHSTDAPASSSSLYPSTTIATSISSSSSQPTSSSKKLTKRLSLSNIKPSLASIGFQTLGAQEDEKRALDEEEGEDVGEIVVGMSDFEEVSDDDGKGDICEDAEAPTSSLGGNSAALSPTSRKRIDEARHQTLERELERLQDIIDRQASLVRLYNDYNINDVRFKATTAKKHPMFRYVPTNLHVQTFSVIKYSTKGAGSLEFLAIVCFF